MSDYDDHFRRYPRLLRRFAVAVALAALAPVLWGCGVGEYRDRLQDRVRDLATASDFAGLYAPQPLPNKPVAVRVPQSFERPPLVAGVPLAEEDAPPDDARVRPGVVELPGLTYTYEEFVTDAEGGRIAYYLYLSAEDTTQHGFRDPNRRWLSQVNARFPDQQVDWENVACDTPEGRSVIWQRLRSDDNPAEDFVGNVLQYVDQNLRLQNMPALEPAVVVRRAEALAARKAANPLPALVELRYYAAKGLLEASALREHYIAILGRQDGVELAADNVDLRRQVVEGMVR